MQCLCCYNLYINGITLYVLFCKLLLSCNIMLLSFLYDEAGKSGSSIVSAMSIPSYDRATISLPVCTQGRPMWLSVPPAAARKKGPPVIRFGGGLGRGGQRACSADLNLSPSQPLSEQQVGAAMSRSGFTTSTRHILKSAGTAQGWVSSLILSSLPHIQGSLLTPVSLERK